MKSARTILESILDDDDELFGQFNAKDVVINYIKTHSKDVRGDWNFMDEITIDTNKQPMVVNFSTKITFSPTIILDETYDPDLFVFGNCPGLTFKITRNDIVDKLFQLPIIADTLFFKGCKNLKTLKPGPHNDSVINRIYFENCPKLKSVDNVYSNKFVVSDVYFLKCPALKKVVYPVLHMDNSCNLHECPNVETLEFLGVPYILNDTSLYDGKTKIKEIIFHSSVPVITDDFYFNCPKLKDIKLDKKRYKIEDFISRSYCKEHDIKISYI